MGGWHGHERQQEFLRKQKISDGRYRSSADSHAGTGRGYNTSGDVSNSSSAYSNRGVLRGGKERGGRVQSALRRCVYVCLFTYINLRMYLSDAHASVHKHKYTCMYVTCIYICMYVYVQQYVSVHIGPYQNGQLSHLRWNVPCVCLVWPIHVSHKWVMNESCHIRTRRQMELITAVEWATLFSKLSHEKISANFSSEAL